MCGLEGAVGGELQRDEGMIGVRCSPVACLGGDGRIVAYSVLRLLFSGC